MKKNNYFSLVKLIGAIMVIIIHSTAYITPFKTFWNYTFYRQVLHLAVPTFFSITGYLTYDKINKSNEYALNYSKNVLALYLSLVSIHFVYYLLLYLSGVTNTNPFLDFRISTFLSGEWNGGLVHLWYLWALSIAFFLIYNFKNKISFVIVLASFLYLINKDGNLQFYPYIAYGGFIKALVYIGIGRLARKSELNIYFNFILIVLSFGLFYYTSTLKWNTINEIYMMLTIYGIVSLGRNVQLQNMKPKLVKLCTHSDNLYYYHMISINFLSHAFPILSRKYHNFPISVILGVIIVIVLTLIISKIIDPFRNKLQDAITRSMLK